jgi:putative oxidoreductase
MSLVDARDVGPRQLVRPLDLGLLLARLPVGLLFFLYGWMKLFKMGVGNFVTMSEKSIPGYLPHALGIAYLHLVPFAEFLVGLAIMLGAFSRVAGLISSLMLISFMMAVTGVGGGEKGPPFNNSIIYLGVTLLLMFAGAGFISIDGMLLDRRTRLI